MNQDDFPAEFDAAAVLVELAEIPDVGQEALGQQAPNVDLGNSADRAGLASEIPYLSMHQLTLDGDFYTCTRFYNSCDSYVTSLLTRKKKK